MIVWVLMGPVGDDGEDGVSMLFDNREAAEATAADCNASPGNAGLWSVHDWVVNSKPYMGLARPPHDCSDDPCDRHNQYLRT